MEGPSPSAVFIHTSLGTHLAMPISDNDTVSDLKKKIKVEHKACFPNVGEILVNAVKVRRKGGFFHLADSMLVRSAFDGVKKNWFLSVDASNLGVYSDRQNVLNPTSSDQPVLLAITSKPSGDQHDTAPDDQPETVTKKLSRLELSATPKGGSYQDGDKVVPVIASENLEVEQNDGVNCLNLMTHMRSLAMNQNKEISTSSRSSDRKAPTLESSSRYKKAKLAASQSQLEDSESQALKFVPDGQDNSLLAL